MVCLNGDHRIAKSAELYQRGLADEILLTVQRNKDVLTRRGVPKSAVKLAPGVRTTFEEAFAIRTYVLRNPVRQVMVVSDPWHLARVRWTFRKVFEGMGTEFVFVASDHPWPVRDWFRDDEARFHAVSEISKILFYWVYYGIMGQKCAHDWVFEWKSRYVALLRWALVIN